jgi:hypothetical protein
MNELWYYKVGRTKIHVHTENLSKENLFITSNIQVWCEVGKQAGSAPSNFWIFNISDSHVNKEKIH